MVIGDLNLDHLRWSLPDNRIARMVNMVKDQIETLGYFQIVNGYTRTWPGMPASLIDHCWLNAPGKLIFHRNVVRSFSDHNLVLVSCKTRNRIENRHDIVKRSRKYLDVEKYKTDIGNIDWTDLYESQNIDVINDIFVKKILEILDEAAPRRVFQNRKLFRKWVSEDMKVQMRDRDILRERARLSGMQEDWEFYRRSRNKCVRDLQRCKNDFYSKLFDKIQSENDMKSLYGLTKEITGGNNGNLPQQLLRQGILVRKPAEMANFLMDFYKKKVTDLIAGIPLSNRNPHRYLDLALSTWE